METIKVYRCKGTETELVQTITNKDNYFPAGIQKSIALSKAEEWLESGTFFTMKKLQSGEKIKYIVSHNESDLNFEITNF